MQARSQRRTAVGVGNRGQRLAELSYFLFRRMLAGGLLLAGLIFFVSLAIEMSIRGGLNSFTDSIPASLEFSRTYIMGIFTRTLAIDLNVGIVLFRSLVLLIASLVLACLIGIPMGILAAAWRHRRRSRTLLFLSVLGISTPSFLAAMLLMWFSLWLGKNTGVSLPVFGVGWDEHMIMPTLALAAIPTANITRLSYTTLMDVIDADYVRTARAKGLKPRVVITRHIIRSAGVPLVTAIGVSIRFSLAILPIIETIFEWRGAGYIVLDAIKHADPVLTITMILPFAIFFVLVNMLLEVSYTAIDPRVKLELASHSHDRKKKRKEGEDQHIRVAALTRRLILAGVCFALLCFTLLCFALLWTVIQIQSDGFVVGLLQRHEAVKASPTVAGGLPESTVAATASEIPSTDTPMPTPTSISNSKEIVLNGTQMIYVAGGTFTMGDGVGFLAHTVTLSPFYIDKYEVTNAHWEACVAAGACYEPASRQSYDGSLYYGEADYANYPVIYVNWYGADTYCRWLGARLPTEAEWEMAARYDAATETETIYPWGNDWLPAANFCDVNCPLFGRVEDVDDGYAQTAPVGSFVNGASAAGVFDMAGNVAEWVGDWYSGGYYAISPEENPTGPASGTLKVVRGGAWGVNTQFVQSAWRSRFEPGISGPGLGLRCAISANEVSPY